ncbi:ABC transporter ATP-binding protein [Methylobrevis albus]|uniref:ABC transporter ATP-binding protein n=1 Tax=Methylobrevis albus TaxID=2793297 RepID=A0A931I0E3_9HYPH|nr:ABC transporter ATP-binding protein [Methylobrevis albus]MBH0236988.1 ABC transporter ATP-binding protein [Methylobrevis albus]
MQTAGASRPVEVRIDRKVFHGANGGEVEAVRGLDLSIAAGSLTALIGPSGCGKTTTLRILGGLDHDYDGSVSVGPETRIGYVFQEPRLLPWRSVDQNVRLVLDDPDAVDLTAIYGRLGISDMGRRFPGELSLGLARRVSIARALAIRPEILLLDEPSASLDETTAQRMRALILDVWQADRPTTVLVTHNIREAIQLADRLVLLAPRPGRMIGDVAIDRPQDARDTAFIETLREDLIRRFPETIA